MSDHNDMMMDLFRSEVESHTESLTTALLALEQDTTATNLIDGMMRAAHSVKGAARIVQIDPAVQVSHVMEDCFVAAQRGEIILRPSGIDVLLKGVDMLSRISEESRQYKPDWSQLQPTITQLVKQLQQVHAGQEPSGNVVVDAPVEAVVTSVPTPEVAIEPVSDFASTSATIYVAEYLNAREAERVRQEYLAQLKQAHVQEIHLDLSATKDLDAIGLAFLDALASHASGSSKVATSITAASPTISRVIQCLDAKSLLGPRH